MPLKKPNQDPSAVPMQVGGEPIGGDENASIRSHNTGAVILLRVEDVCELLKISRSKVYEMKGKIGYYKIGGSVRFLEDDVLRYIEACKVNGNAKPCRVNPRLRHLHLS